MSVQRREDLDMVTRLMLFPRECLARGGVTILELRGAYFMAPTKVDHEALLEAARAHLPYVHGDVSELLEAFELEQADDAWRRFVSKLVAQSMRRRTTYELRSCFRGASRTREAMELIIDVSCQSAEIYDDLLWLYRELDTEDERRSDVYEKLVAAAFARLHDALHFLEQVALPTSGDDKAQVLCDAWNRIQPLVYNAQCMLDLLPHFQAFGAPEDVLAAIIDRAANLAKTPMDTARLWAHDNEHVSAAFRATLLHNLMEGYPSWTAEEWLDVLSVDGRLLTLLAPRMEEHFYPKLTQSRHALDACYRVASASVRERAFSLAIQTAQTLEDWQGIIAVVINGVVESRGVDTSYHARMRDAARSVEDWLSILHWPFANELDRASAVDALRSLLTE